MMAAYPPIKSEKHGHLITNRDRKMCSIWSPVESERFLLAANFLPVFKSWVVWFTQAH
jgi:hypothetical protein